MPIINGLTICRPAYEPVRRYTPVEMKAQNVNGMGGGPAKAPVPGVPAVRITDGVLDSGHMKSDLFFGGRIGDERAEDVHFVTYDGDTGGFFVSGKCRYEIERATLSLSGPSYLGEERAGICAHSGAEVIVRDSIVYANGRGRSCLSAVSGATLRAYGSTFVSMGAPFDLEKDRVRPGCFDGWAGNTRTSDVQDNSEAYYKNCTIVADGWGILSADGSQGYIRIEADDCRIVANKAGYATYSDTFCHNYFNRCDVSTAGMTGCMAGEGDLTYNDCRLRSGRYMVAVQCQFSVAQQRSTFNCVGCDVDTGCDAILVRGANLLATIDHSVIRSKTGVLLRTEYNPNPEASRVNGASMFGVDLTLKNGRYTGDIFHTDPERGARVYLESCRYEGAVHDAAIHFGPASRWKATGDSEITLNGPVDLSAIYADQGVTIRARAAENGEHILYGGGKIIFSAG